MPRRRLFRKYVVPFVAVVCVAVLASGLLEIWFSYRDSTETLTEIQHEKALAAAARIETFVKEIERQIGWAMTPAAARGAAGIELRRLDFLRLQRQAPAVTEVAWLDAAGREQLRISRLAMEVVGSGTDFSADPSFTVARQGTTWFGPVSFRKGSEPYMTIALGGKQGVTTAEVNLKLIWEVVSQIKVGKRGHAYVVDAQGQLIAHPDISLVLKKTDLSTSAQVRAAHGGRGAPTEKRKTVIAHDPVNDRRVLTAFTPLAPLGWTVFVEQPLVDAFAPLWGSVLRTGVLMLVGVILSVVASLVLARRMTKPIEALGASAARIGGGDLGHRIEIHTGDELEMLADEFNTMTARLQESHATLERRVEERTRELSEALDQQTATSEILRGISSSPTDVQPVFDAIAESAARLCGASDSLILRAEGDMIRRVAHFGPLVSVSDVRRLTPETPSGRAILEGRTIHLRDILEDLSRGDYAESKALQQGSGMRTVLATPLIREGSAIGVITIRRTEVRPFSDKQIALLQTFADQAVIAIENVRLFTELQQRTGELTRSVEELTALGEVGRAISSTLDLETVLTTIVSRAVELSGAAAGTMFEYDEAIEEFRPRASHNAPRELIEIQRAEPVRLGQGALGQAAARREPVQVSDIREAPFYSARPRVRDLLVESGYRSVLAVPLMVEDRILGALVVLRREVGEFAQEAVNLLQTFATQSALAIQNARLFTEIEEKGRQLEVANRHKSEFLANMSHELRTPLNAVIGFSEVLLEKMFGEVNTKQEEYLKDIYDSGRHLLSLINDILDLSKVEAGRMELELTRFDLPAAIDNALTLVKGRAANHAIKLTPHVDPRLGEFVADERKLKQVLVNLLSNAVKFTPEGGHVEVRAAPADGGVEIAVTDTGIGIAPEDHEAIFEEFRQVGSDYARKREGTGLGLTLTRRFVELHGGRIWVKSAPGEGSTFTFTLPERPWPAS